MKTNFISKTGRALKRASPIILTFVGTIGVVATAVLAVKATPKALKCIDEANNEKYTESNENLTRMETFSACWHCYIPAAITGLATIGCICSINVLNRRQQASIASAYALLSRQFQSYKYKVRELYGEEAHQKVMESLRAEKPEAPCIYGSAFGENFGLDGLSEEKHLFYDSFSETYFEATPAQVLMAEYHTNRNFALNGGEIPLQSFYGFLGLDTPREMKDLSWFVCDDYSWIDFTHNKVMVDDGLTGEIECWVIDMLYPPTLDVPE